MIPHTSLYLTAILDGFVLSTCIALSIAGGEFSGKRLALILAPILLINIIILLKWWLRLEKDRNEGRWKA